MPCHLTPAEVICTGGPLYEYGGYLFEVHRYVGPHPVNRKTHDPLKKIPTAFWNMWERFQALTKDEQAAFAVDRAAKTLNPKGQNQ